MMPTRHGTAEVSLPSEREILITRHFEAPARLLWEALTTPRHLLRWWGPDWCPMIACEVDLRVGGSWRYVCRGDDGNELGWHGTYRDIESAARIVSTEVFEGFPEAESVNTMTLSETDGVTTLRTLVLHSSREHRDGHVASGMETGMQQTFDRLEDLLRTFDSTAERWSRVAGRFTDRVREVPSDAWERPAPCEGWVARDVVRHMVEWMPSFMANGGVELPAGPSVDDDPLRAWTTLSDGVQAILDDPAAAAAEFDTPPVGKQRVEQAIASFLLGDVLVHTWDLARATGLDESLDETIVGEMLVGMLPYDEMLRRSGHYGARVDVADDADAQTKLIAFTGRTP